MMNQGHLRFFTLLIFTIDISFNTKVLLLSASNKQRNVILMHMLSFGERRSSLCVWEMEMCNLITFTLKSDWVWPVCKCTILMGIIWYMQYKCSLSFVSCHTVVLIAYYCFGMSTHWWYDRVALWYIFRNVMGISFFYIFCCHWSLKSNCNCTFFNKALVRILMKIEKGRLSTFFLSFMGASPSLHLCLLQP